jgi:nitrite reductase/ring-hydroxylating ferredoxin subunit
MLDLFLKPSGGSRRDLFRSLGLVALGGGTAAVLGACSGGDSGSGSAGGSGSASAAAPQTVAMASVPQGSGVVKGGFVITQPTAGDFKAFSNICTHQGCPISQVSGDKITCNCHGSEFSVKDGSVLHGPADRPLEAAKVTVDGENLDVSA